MPSLLKQSITNSFFLNVGSVSSVIIALLFAGFQIRFLGVEAAGFLMLLESITSMSTRFGGFGFGTAALKKIAEYHGQKKYKEIKYTLSAVLCVDCILGLIVAIGLIIGFRWIFNWSKTADVFFEDAQRATYFFALTFILRQIKKTYGVVFSAFQRYDIIALINTVVGLLTGGIGIITLMIWPTMTAIAIVIFVIAFINFSVTIVMVYRLTGEVVFPIWNYEELKTMGKFGGWVYLGTLSSILVANADKFILTSFLGSQSLPYYVIGQRVVTQVHTFLSGQSQFLFPMLASKGEQIKEIVNNIEDRLRWFVAALSSIAYGSLALVAYPLLTMLIGEDFAKIALVPFLIACIQGFLASSAIVTFHINWAKGNGAPNSLMNLASGILVSVTMVLLTPIFGIIGTSIAQLWVGITSFALIYWAARINKNVNWWEIIRPLLTPTTTFLLFFIGAIIIIPLFSTYSIIYQLILIFALAIFALMIGGLIEEKLFYRYMCINTLKKVVTMVYKKVVESDIRSFITINKTRS